MATSSWAHSWENAQMYQTLWLQPAAEDAGNPDVLAQLDYTAKQFRQIIGAVYKKRGVIDDTDFTVTQGVTAGQINISRGTAVITNPTPNEGLYIVQSDSIEGLTLPASIGSTANQFRLVLQVADKADAPNPDFPNEYGWSFRIMQSDTGTALPAEPTRSLTIAYITRTGTGALTIDQWMKYTAAAGGGTLWKDFPYKQSYPIGGNVDATRQGYYSTWYDWSLNVGGSGWQRPAYRRNNDGLVSMKGLLGAGASSNTGEYALVLPIGYRPGAYIMAACMGRSNNVQKAIRVQINTDGTVHFYTGDSDSLFNNGIDYVSLSGITFYAYGY